MTEPIPVPEPVRCTLLFGAVAAIVVLAFTSRVRDAGASPAVGASSTWSGLAQLGVEPDLLDRLESDGKTTVAFGLVFDHRVAHPADAALALREVWWNEEWKLPLRVVRRVEGRDSAQEVVHEIVALEETAAAPARAVIVR